MEKISIGLMEPVERWEGHYYPIGIMYLSSYLQQQGYPNLIINKKIFPRTIARINTADRKVLVMEEVKKRGLEVLGITCALNEIGPVLSFCLDLKKGVPNLIVVLGGPMPTANPELFLKNGSVDFVVRGEGEKIMSNLVRALKHDEPLSQVRGISYLDGKKIIHQPPEELIEDLDVIPMPAYEKINMEQYTSVHEWVIRGMPMKAVYVMTSRGCPYKCSFCGAHTIHGRKIRFRSAQNVYTEIQFLRQKFQIEGIFFCDDTLTANRKHLSEICEVMRSLKMPWSCFSRADLINKKVLYLMKKSGCVQIDFGVESGSDRILQETALKNMTTKQIRDAFLNCDKFAIRTFANLMIGFPGETEDEMYRTFRFAKSLHADAYVLSIAMPIPNTDLWSMVNPQIAVEEFDKLNWHGEDLYITDKCNKSLVSTKRLIYLHHYFSEKLRFTAKLKTFKHYYRYLFTLLRFPNKSAHLLFELKYRLKDCGTIYNFYRFFKHRLAK